MPRKGKGKRKPEEVNGEIKCNEKEKLLQALKDHGPSVIYDENLLKSYFPANSCAEIKFLISSYEKKGKELCSKENYFDSFPEIANIAQWSALVSNCVPFPAKKDDLSQTLKDVFGKMGRLYSSSNSTSSPLDEDINDNGDDNCSDNEGEKVDYKAVHSYFNSILDGRFPVQLEDREAAVALSIMDNLIEMTQSLGNSNEIKFLQSEAWWKTTPALTNGSTSDPQIVETEIINHASSSQNINHNGQDIDTVQPDTESTELYEDLPRIRKIRECLNPLKIPKSMLDENHDLMTSFLI